MSAERRIRIWTAPILLGAVSAVGLIAALLADGAGDLVGGIALGIPVGVSLWYVLPLSQRSRRPSIS